jgi:hypothetical protein
MKKFPIVFVERKIANLNAENRHDYERLKYVEKVPTMLKLTFFYYFAEVGLFRWYIVHFMTCM